MSDYKHYIPEASGHYFTEHLPDDWHTWEREELDDWCEQCVWQPFVWHPSDWVFEQVDNLAMCMNRIVNEATKPLEDAVAECEQEVDRLRQRLIKENADG